MENNSMEKEIAVPSVEDTKTKEGIEARTKEWEKMLAEVDSWTDAQGTHIEPGIKEVVAGFNVLGLKTKQSCEGHSNERGLPYPWISFSVAGEPEERFVGEKSTFKRVAEEKKALLDYDAPYHGLDEETYWEVQKEVVNNEETDEYKNWAEKNKKLYGKTLKAVELFNSTHNLPDNLKLRVSQFYNQGFELASVDDETTVWHW